MKARWDRVEQDLRSIFASMPLNCLLHLRDNRHRLVRHAYQTEDGGGCIMTLLTESLPVTQRIHSKAALQTFFCDPALPLEARDEDPQYQPARWIVRFWDQQCCERLRRRYGNVDELRESFLLRVLNTVIAERQELESAADQVRSAALNRLADRVQ